jgi:hypothetical protein
VDRLPGDAGAPGGPGPQEVVRMGRWIRGAALGLALALGAAGAWAEEPEEAPLEGEDKAKHEREVATILHQLHTEKNRETVAGRIERLGAAPSRAGRDALIAFATGNKNQQFVKKAFDALARVNGRVAVAFLCGKAALQSGDFLVQHSAAVALATAKNPLAIAPCLDVLTAPGTKIEVMGAVAIAAAKSGPTDERVAETLFRLSRDKKDTIRSNAVEAIGFLGTDRALERLTEVLHGDKNARVRGSAATGMMNAARREMIPVLEAAHDRERAFQVKDKIREALTALEASGS